MGLSRDISRRHFLLGSLGLIASPLIKADTYPNKPIKMIVPVPPGGGADAVARGYAQQMSKFLGKQIVIENRAGAAGIIAMEALSKAPPDGYTLIQTNISTISINPFIYNKLPYDAFNDFSAISLTSSDPLILVVNSNLQVSNLKELLSYAKSKNSGLTYGSLGNGSIQHLCGHVFGIESSMNFLHVAYKGAAPVTVDLIGGQIDMAFSGPGTVAGHIKSGKLVPIAITGNERNPFFPELPTLKELGYKRMGFTLWNGLLAPSGTPQSIIQTLSNATQKAAQTTELVQSMSQQNIQAIANSPEDFSTLIKQEQTRYSQIVKESNIQAS
ncbi:Bug family tripartite tricarboxylate transporter substrate binding protein [Polynucleobacter rarus]|uniref:Bug family tripartite tricarboxylate transporter substrate binding protein n=1 Tax=Polynucleobacter rarus TaxID=556055 RepID=UPI000D3E1966|nr:tripartite tricarboxylate transporter substrate binding protein [Polynucleobacter rarus]